MTEDRHRLFGIWRRTFSLGWPIVTEQTLSTLMRTVDLLVTGLFSPAAVAAVGLADLYAQIPLRLGLGLGTGAITLSSQDTGRGAQRTRNLAITQAFLLGTLVGLPFVLIGWQLGPVLIDVLGAESDVVRLGGQYLAIIFAAAPMRIVGKVGAGSLQGTGDTVTPMYVNGAANALNIVLTLLLGLGLWVAPTLGIVGVGLATAISRTFEAAAFTGFILSDRTPLSFTRPRDLTVTRQLVSVSVPRFAEGMSGTVANFPFNGLILLFGTEANAAYHIGRRIFQQFSAPSYRAFGLVSSIIVGQTLGSDAPDEARYEVKALLSIALLVLGGLGVVLFLAAEVVAGLFTQDPVTRNVAIVFTRVFAGSLFFMGVFAPLAGALRGAGDTRTPFVARLLGAFGCMVGISYLLAVPFGLGLSGVYVGLFLSYVCMAAVVAAGIRWGDWERVAEAMIAQRSASGDGAT